MRIVDGSADSCSSAMRHEGQGMQACPPQITIDADGGDARRGQICRRPLLFRSASCEHRETGEKENGTKGRCCSLAKHGAFLEKTEGRLASIIAPATLASLSRRTNLSIGLPSLCPFFYNPT